MGENFIRYVFYDSGKLNRNFEKSTFGAWKHCAGKTLKHPGVFCPPMPMTEDTEFGARIYLNYKVKILLMTNETQKLQI